MALWGDGFDVETPSRVQRQGKLSITGSGQTISSTDLCTIIEYQYRWIAVLYYNISTVVYLARGIVDRPPYQVSLVRGIVDRVALPCFINVSI